MDTLSQRVHNVDTFSAELYKQMADLPAASRNAAQAGAEELDATIRLPVRRTQTGQNLEVLGYGE